MIRVDRLWLSLSVRAKGGQAGNHGKWRSSRSAAASNANSRLWLAIVHHRPLKLFFSASPSVAPFIGMCFIQSKPKTAECWDQTCTKKNGQPNTSRAYQRLPKNLVRNPVNPWASWCWFRVFDGFKWLFVVSAVQWGWPPAVVCYFRPTTTGGRRDLYGHPPSPTPFVVFELQRLKINVLTSPTSVTSAELRIKSLVIYTQSGTRWSLNAC